MPASTGRLYPSSVSRALARRAVACCFPDLRHLDAEQLPEARRGWDSHTLTLGRSYFLQVPRDWWRGRDMWKLRSLTPRLAGHLDLKIPELTHFSSRCPTLGVPISACRRCPGTPLLRRRFQKLDRDLHQENARILGRFLTQTHRFPIKVARACGTPETGRSPQPSWVRGVLKEVLPLLSGKRRAGAKRLMEERLEISTPMSRWRSFIHRDLGEEHIFTDRTGKVTSVIDWADAGIGDPALDIAGIVMSYGVGFAKDVLRHYDAHAGIRIEDNMMVRLRAMPLGGLLHATRAKDPILLARALRELDGVLAGREPPA